MTRKHKNKLIKNIDKNPKDEDIEEYRKKMQKLSDIHWNARQVILEIQKNGPCEEEYVMVL